MSASTSASASATSDTPSSRGSAASLRGLRLHHIGLGRGHDALAVATGRLRHDHRVTGVVSGEAALAHAGSAPDAITQVVELGAPHIAAGGDLDLLDLGRVHGERALDADAEGLLADGERLAQTAALALDDDALEHLGAAAIALDDLEVHPQAITSLEGRDAAQLGALDVVDDTAHAF